MSSSPGAGAGYVLLIMVVFIGNVSWVGSTPRSPVPASLHIEAIKNETESLLIAIQTMTMKGKYQEGN